MDYTRRVAKVKQAGSVNLGASAKIVNFAKEIGEKSLAAVEVIPFAEYHARGLVARFERETELNLIAIETIEREAETALMQHRK